MEAAMSLVWVPPSGTGLLLEKKVKGYINEKDSVPGKESKGMRNKWNVPRLVSFLASNPHDPVVKDMKQSWSCILIMMMLIRLT